MGGSLLSPLPWQLAGDSARWSQNWSWRPSPERGEITKVPSICTMCEGGCGIQARLVNGNRAILVEGNPANPVTEGGICPLGAAGLQFLYAPYRISRPLKQTKGRGNISGFQPITWDEALAELGKKLAIVRGESKAHTVACITSGRQSSMDDLWQQLFSAYGSQNLFKMPTQADGLRSSALLTTGIASPYTFALENATHVLSFGSNLLEGAAAPGRAFAALRQWRQNGNVKLVQVESRCSLTASKADQWLAVEPGAEAAIALSIAHVMIAGNTYDADFVKNNVFGFEDWTDSTGKRRQGFKTLVSSPTYSPEEIAKKAKVDAAAIRALAKDFAAQKNAIAVWNLGHSDLAFNTYDELAFVALNVLKGNIKTGGLVNLTADIPLGALPAVEKDALAENAAQQKRLDLTRDKTAPVPQNGLYGFLDSLAHGSKYPIEVLMVHEANPAYSLMESRLFQAALDKIKMLVSFSSFMDETACLADLVLPNHTALERLDDVKGIPAASFSYYAVSSPILKPLGDTKNTGDAVLALAGKIGGTVASSVPWKTYEEFLKFRVKGLAETQKGAVADKAGIRLTSAEPVKPNFKDGDDLWKKLKAGACWYDAPAEMPSFKTASGKLELACQAIPVAAAADDHMFLPHLFTIKLAGGEQDFPLLLVAHSTGYLTSGYLANPPFMNKLIPDWTLKGNEEFVDVNPQTAQSLGLSQGQSASLRTTQGEATVRVNVTSAARPGVVFLPKGLGHKAYDEYIQNKGTNANSLMEVLLDPVSGMGTVWATRAQLRRV
ncbi:MAG: molybdopterin-dependent oxidoreductase [Desulfobacteraceae bacterium]|nr:molybdopterin-dependent oxidoreductase [Desulfobacteraceae bacterium]